jgi:hypothetical protein
MQLPFGPGRKRPEVLSQTDTTGTRRPRINLKVYFLLAFLISSGIVFVPLTLILVLPKFSDYLFDSMSVQEVIEHGAAYGVEIGGTKSQTFEDLELMVLDKPLLVSGIGLENTPSRFLLSDDFAHDILMRSDHWHLLFSETTIDVLRLHFVDGKLAKIIRVKTSSMPPERWGSLLPSMVTVASTGYFASTT